MGRTVISESLVRPIDASGRSAPNSKGHTAGRSLFTSWRGTGFLRSWKSPER